MECLSTLAPYYFLRNLQGDIVAIYNTSGDVVASYLYDAWGNCTIASDSNATVANANSFRYRGYYLDRETGFYYLNSRYYSPKFRRFISPDDTVYLDPESVNGLNLYCYCNNDPVNFVDPSGHFWDCMLDAFFIAWGIADLAHGGWRDWKNWAALGVDLVFAVLPFVSAGVGQVVKVGNRIDNAVDVAAAINKIDNLQDVSKVTMIGRNMDRVKDTATLINKTDNIYDMWKGFDTIKDCNKPLGYVLSGMDNGIWMYGKLRNGYTVIDIGITTTHRGFGWYYGIEQFIIAQWKTRNLWKIPVNLM